MGEVDMIRATRKSFLEVVILPNDNQVRKRGKKFQGEALREKVAWRIPEDRVFRKDRQQ